LPQNAFISHYLAKQGFSGDLTVFLLNIQKSLNLNKKLSYEKQKEAIEKNKRGEKGNTGRSN
jgi:hypothetical protein